MLLTGMWRKGWKEGCRRRWGWHAYECRGMSIIELASPSIYFKNVPAE